MVHTNVTTDKQVLTPEDNFQQSTAACMRSIAQDAELETNLSESASAAQLGVKAPTIESPLNHDVQQALVRGLGDAIALLGAFHNTQLHQQALPEHAREQFIFNAIERIRCESLGAIHYRGVAKNLAWLQHRTHSAQSVQTYNGIEQLTLVLEVLVRQALTGEAVPVSLQFLVERWREVIESRAADYLAELVRFRNDQQTYASLVLKIIRALDVQSLVSTSEPEESVDQTPVETLSDDEEEQLHSSADTPEDDNEAMMEQAAADVMREELEEQQEAIQSAVDDANEPGSTHPNKDAPVSSDAQSNGGTEMPGVGGYRVFTSEFDEVVSAGELSSEAELTELREKLDVNSNDTGFSILMKGISTHHV